MASKLHNALAKKLPDIQMSEAFINSVFLASPVDFRMHIHILQEMKYSPTHRPVMWFL